jgi:hypothetical protein
MKKKPILFVVVVLVIFPSFCLSKDIPFSQDDRDRLIKLEARVEEGFKAVNQRVDAVNLRIDDLRSEVQSLRQLIYVVIAGIFALIGFVIWDRRTALSPAIKKNKELEERQDRVEKAFKELARRDSSVAEVLRNVGLL